MAAWPEDTPRWYGRVDSRSLGSGLRIRRIVPPTHLSYYSHLLSRSTSKWTGRVHPAFDRIHRRNRRGPTFRCLQSMRTAEIETESKWIKTVAHLGRVYADREVIVRQGEPGNCMYVVQDGQVEAVAEAGGGEMRLRTLGPNNFFGEMALFESESRSCTIRALGKARVLTIDKKTFLAGIQEDPSLAFRIVKVMSQRIHDLTERLAEYEARK